jgi:hypothetical protein
MTFSMSEKKNKFSFERKFNFDNYFLEQKCKQTSSRLSFDDKLAAHHSNRLNETFGQINLPYELQSKSEKEINLVPLRYQTSSNNGTKNS